LIGACEVRSWVEVRRGRDWNFWGLRQNKRATWIRMRYHRGNRWRWNLCHCTGRQQQDAYRHIPHRVSSVLAVFFPYSNFALAVGHILLSDRTCRRAVRKSTCSQQRSTSFSSNARQSPKRVWAYQGPNHLNVTHLARRPGTARRRLHIPLPPLPDRPCAGWNAYGRPSLLDCVGGRHRTAGRCKFDGKSYLSTVAATDPFEIEGSGDHGRRAEAFNRGCEARDGDS